MKKSHYDLVDLKIKNIISCLSMLKDVESNNENCIIRFSESTINGIIMDEIKNKKIKTELLKMKNFFEE